MKASLGTHPNQGVDVIIFMQMRTPLCAISKASCACGPWRFGKSYPFFAIFSATIPYFHISDMQKAQNMVRQFSYLEGSHTKRYKYKRLVFVYKSKAYEKQ